MIIQYVNKFKKFENLDLVLIDLDRFETKSIEPKIGLQSAQIRFKPSMLLQRSDHIF